MSPILYAYQTYSLCAILGRKQQQCNIYSVYSNVITILNRNQYATNGRIVLLMAPWPARSIQIGTIQFYPAQEKDKNVVCVYVYCIYGIKIYICISNNIYNNDTE